MRKVTLGYYVNNRVVYFYVLYPSVRKVEKFNPLAGSKRINTFEYKKENCRHKVILKCVATSWHVFNAPRKEPFIELTLSRKNYYLNKVGEDKFRILVEGIMAYNTLYNNNSELEEDMYIKRFEGKNSLREYADRSGVSHF